MPALPQGKAELGEPVTRGVDVCSSNRPGAEFGELILDAEWLCPLGKACLGLCSCRRFL